MEYSHQSILDIAQICAQHGLTHCIACPGSRCAPLTIAFARHTAFKTLSISDERSAAFVALGLAEATNKAVVLICTSGTATLNFAPAIAEAYYRQVPLLVLTADRPPEWIDQWDGQTIRQTGIYANFIKASFQLPDSYQHKEQVWQIHRTINQALLLCQQGPVHVNIPLREPFYPQASQLLSYGKNLPFFKKIPASISLAPKEIAHLQQQINSFSKILMVKGQDKRYSMQVPESVPLVADIISNPERNSTAHHDLFLGVKNLDFNFLRPELLITYGKSLISKNLKLFLRKYPPLEHWHIGSSYADVFQCLTRIVDVEPPEFFEALEWEKISDDYLQQWRNIDHQTHELLHEKQFEGYFGLVGEFLRGLREVDLHLANSMSVRYANFWGVDSSVRVFANRGTSGIDGSTSTAVGHCVAKPHKKQVLITGDVAFFYDRNAFWNQLPKDNLIVLLLNDKGGSIFKMIDGPAQQKEVDDFFVTQQKLDAQKICEEFGIQYVALENIGQLTEINQIIFDSKGCVLIEALSSSNAEASNFRGVKDYLQSKLLRSISKD